MIIVDIETTGLKFDECSITEIGAIRVNHKMQVIGEFQTFAKPTCHIPEFITRLTGITDEDVKDAPSQEEAVKAFFAWANQNPGEDMYAYNSSFDFGFLNYIAKTDYPHKDILTMARKAFPGMRSHKLQTLAKVLKVEVGSAHRAVDDCKTSLHVLRYCFRYPNGERHYSARWGYRLAVAIGRVLGKVVGFFKRLV